ncbi:MAG TPA: PAS domain S-box protein [Thermomicrobiales bacterium]|nr:PAS domain S-box protein [Thermomicrobiales bacterium]
MSGTSMNIADPAPKPNKSAALLDNERRRLAAIVESSNDAIISENLDGIIVSWNSAAERIYGFSTDEVIGKHITEVIPTARDGEMLELMLRVRRGEQVPSFEVRRTSKEGIVRDVNVKVSPVRDESGEIIGVSAIVRDISDRVSIERELQNRIRQQAAVAQLGQHAIAQTNLTDLLNHATELVRRTLDIEFATVLELIPGSQEMLLRAGVGWKPGVIGMASVSALPISQSGYTLQSHEPVIISDLRTESRFTQVDLMREHGIISGMSVIIQTPERAFGVLSGHTSQQRTFSIDDVHFLEAIANILATAIARQQAYDLLGRRVEERTSELRMLLDITHDAAATLDLQPLVGLILDRVKEVVDYTGAALFVLEDSGEGLNLLRYQGPIPQHTLAYRWSLATHPHAHEVVTRARPVIINDVYSDHPLAEAFRRASKSDLGELRSDWGSWMGVPMMLRDRVIGMLSVEIDQVNAYTGRHAELLLAVADHAAMAVENARLYERARGLAALEERQKLARELHDSVSQALFGIGLGARTARALLDRDPSKVADPLDYVVSLAEAALTEMRALIFELRPDALQQDGLVGILDKQAAALAARHKLNIETDLGSEPDATLEVKEALYRIGQEALHNAVRHAHATTIWVRLNQAGQGLTLEILDNGVGFDPEGSFPGHLGLQSMRERAARMGAVILVESAPGEGARLQVIVPPAR